MNPRGAILAGGASRRMGRTKALVEVDGVPMGRRIADVALAGGCRDVVLIGGDPDELAPLEIAVVRDLHPDEGPLGGVITALTNSPADAEVVLVIPCDVPYLDSRTVRLLLDAAEAAPQADAVVARSDRLEPSCAVWRRGLNVRLEVMFAEGERALHRVLQHVRTVEVPVDPSVMLNVNRIDDLR